MPSNVNSADIKIVYLRCVGGEIGAHSILAPKVRPLGLSPKQIGDDIARATQDWKGLKITCKLTVQNGKCRIDVVPSAACLIMKELNVFHNNVRLGKNNGDLTLESIIKIARIMRPRSTAKKLEGTVKEILGTAQQVGCTVDGLHPHDIVDLISNSKIEIPAE